MSRLITPIALALLLCAAAAVPAGAVSGGSDLPIAAAPYIVSINSNCTGTLISPTRILTAGHCLDGKSATDAVVLVGVDNHLLTDKQRVADALPVRGFSVHHRFRESFPFAHKSPVNAIAIDDVGLIVLKRPVTNVKPIRVAGPADGALEAAGTAASILGYGDTAQQAPAGTIAPVKPLQAGPLSVISPKDCSAAYPNAVLGSMICTEDLTRSVPLFVQACAGDSGGPIVVSTPAGPVQIGITSWGPEVKDGACGQVHLPNVEMRVSQFRSFITDPSPALEPAPRDGKPQSGFGGSVAHITGTVKVGRTVACSIPKLTDSKAKLSYEWTLSQDTSKVIARGHHLKITKKLFDSAKSPRRLFCAATARNSGGSLGLGSGSRRILP